MGGIDYDAGAIKRMLPGDYGSAQDRTDPSTTSGDYDNMKPYWDMVECFMDGTPAMRAAAEKYLPRFDGERDEDYQDRRKNARFTNIYADIIDDLAARPFAQPVKLDEGASPAFTALFDDIDGSGTDLHTFAHQTFHDGIHRAVDWILVDFTKALAPPSGRPLSQTEELAQGLRPYWVHIAANRLLAVEKDFINGGEIVTHARWREDSTVRDGFATVVHERIRVMDRAPIMGIGIKPVDYAPAIWLLYEKKKNVTTGRETWEVIDQGTVSIGYIPLVDFPTGRRCGNSERFIPPMRGVADLQAEHYEAENDLKHACKMTAFPMLAANGINPIMEGDKPKKLQLGPRSVLYAPIIGDTGRHGEWKFIEPNGTSLTFLSGEIDKIEHRMRELGRQPLTADSGNLTVVTTAFAAQKGNSMAQSWAITLESALEQALKFTAMWLNEPKAPTVQVFTDFNIDTDDKGPDVLLAMRKAGDLTRETLWTETRRRDILRPEFDAKAENAALEAEKAKNLNDQVNALKVLGPLAPQAQTPAEPNPPAPPAAKAKTPPKAAK